jgi:hypothetical protein
MIYKKGVRETVMKLKTVVIRQQNGAIAQCWIGEFSPPL